MFRGVSPGTAVAFDTSVHPDDGLSMFLRVRPRLFGIAYRMLRSSVDAEDIVQDAWVRWQTTDRASVRNAAAFLATATTRLAINAIQSARARHEICVESWQPEPVDASAGADPAFDVDRREALALGVVVLTKNLSRTERSAYILREAFDYPYRDIANALKLEEANARQMVSRARRRLGEGARTQSGEDYRHETRDRRRYRPHRIEAGEEAA